MDDPVLPAEQRFFAAQGKNPGCFFSCGRNPCIQDLPTGLDPMILDDSSYGYICFYKVIFEFRGETGNGCMGYCIDQHFTARRVLISTIR